MNEENNIEDIDKKVDAVVSKSEQVQKAFDNIVFRKKVREEPIRDKHLVKGLTVETIDLSPFLNMRLWTRGIYTTDKLIRLGYSARYEFLKRYLEKKRKASFDILWIILIIMGVVITVVVLVMLLPRLTGG